MSALLLALLLQSAPAAEAPGHQATPAGQATAAEHAAAADHTAATEHRPAGSSAADEHAAGASSGHDDPAAVIMHHVIDVPLAIGPKDAPWVVFHSKHLVFFVLAILLTTLIARLALRSYRGGQIPHGIGAAVEAIVLFVRDDIAEANIGHGDGRKFTPLLCSFFCFILVAALLGLMPFAATSTGNLAVTLGLALVSFAAQQYAGISKYGIVGHFKNLIPPGIPKPLLPLMAIVEVISMFTKPFALLIRLFANMLAGHMVVTTLILLISLMAEMHWLGGVAMTPVSIGLALFILLLEVLVAFIQAYIFTLLSAIFIGMYAHPAH
jgi:F-type H+-transporting ATPase subunit a